MLCAVRCHANITNTINIMFLACMLLMRDHISFNYNNNKQEKQRLLLR